MSIVLDGLYQRTKECQLGHILKPVLIFDTVMSYINYVVITDILKQVEWGSMRPSAGAKV
jgi:hypothetical protein